MSLATIASTFAVLFVAELGDKTQLVAMSLAHRHRAAPVLAGILTAFLVLNVLAVAVGAVLFELVPKQWILLAAGLLFLAFGYRIWREGEEDEEMEDVAARGGWRVALGSFALIFVAELGDKTQLALVALAASTGETLAVLIGGTLALWLVSLLGVAVGATLLRRIPAVWVHRVAAVLFFAFGAWALFRAATG
ncbi:TMEM165/GDT1 family protein [Thiohalorhabdus sp. Cl-TMA]|uniref:GDT1 family protein n=1 Tax=Thiohalorhabdus methylotrophus TaxID=3242694 RepID=A0ABV4TT00_9GAMM